MTTRIPAAASAAILALLLGGAACAPGATTDDEPAADTDVAVRVTHDILSARSLIVHLVHPLGTTRRLGLVRPGATEVFQVRRQPVSGDYQLVAKLTDGSTYTSTPFILTGREGVEWSPGNNLVTPISGP